ncbi:hypothetical protein UPYG_G00292350 [Umbra pygmaea]|uniref:Scaffold protein involved in DNA repair n=1 Tax=Umbra pygmaea TaxID=75934 RepID=A0ABD0W5H2_UMBPY
MSFQRKRKKYSKDIKCILFPDDDVKVGARKMGIEPSIITNSASNSWERCGDSFLNTPLIKNLSSSGKKWQHVRQQSPAQAQGGGPHYEEEEPVHIAWSSSDSELSDGEAQAKQPAPPPPSHTGAQQHSRPRGPAASKQSYSRALRRLCTETHCPDDLLKIDPDSDSEVADDVEEENISECGSERYIVEPNQSFPKLTTAEDPDISDYPSDEEGDSADTPTQSCLEAVAVKGGTRSVSDWVRSAQAALQTPQKQTTKNAKTPEDSHKKKITFQRGGLAERLNRLQSRQRSAISFWRHQSISCTNRSSAVHKPGVLVLEVLSVQEESCMQMALCEHHPPATDQHRPPSNTSITTADQDNLSATDHTLPPSGPVRARVLVLFNKETVGQLAPAPGDVIYVYPPWQSLMIDGQHNTIILNTHFSQKVYSDTKQASRVLVPVVKCSPYSLARTFHQVEFNKTLPVGHGIVQKVSAQSLCCIGGSVTRRSSRWDSLLEAIEGLGQAGPLGRGVEVVVQRVYCTPVREQSARASLKSRVLGRSPTVPPSVQNSKNRLCALVQDSYGMFSVVQLHLLPSEDQLHLYSSKWQGRTCILRAIKVVQRVTRERYSRLFSLIDSLWPPPMSLKIDGGTQNVHNDSRPKGPAPSFCYFLSGQESSVEPVEGEPVSTLYLRPTVQTLRDILECELSCHCCSFVATVIHSRIQYHSGDVAQVPGEVWLIVTDPSLQQPEVPPCRRTLAVCMTTSCVLTSSVAKAISTPGVCYMSFRDAVKEHGVILCVEQSVVQLQPLVCCPQTESQGGAVSGSFPQTLQQASSQPVRLDPLSPETSPNSLCTVTGRIVSVDEDTAYSWPICNMCGSDRLETAPQKTKAFHCVACDSLVDRPTVKMHLEVFINCSTVKESTVKIKLQQSTIKSLLNAASPGQEFPGYEVENVLGRELGPLSSYVRMVTRKPTLWISLEEICL